MKFFKSRKSYFLSIAFLFFFLGGWIFSYMSPVVQGLKDENGFYLKNFVMDDYRFFGTISHASIPSLFGGSNIPFLDKVNFQINEDQNATFVLYTSQEILDDLSEWFTFGGFGSNQVPLEITAARIDEHTFVVHSMGSTYWELDLETLVEDYQFYYTFLGLCLVMLLGLFGLVFVLLWLVVKKKQIIENPDGE